METSRPKIGLALSGASSRSVFYIGFLEVLVENNFPIDHISAMSGSAIVAASFACGTMENLKKLAFSMTSETVKGVIEPSKTKGGLYELNKFESLMRVYTKNANFEDTKPGLSIVATDLVSKEEVVLQVGDVAKAVVASCCLPAIFTPIRWGNRQLVDGGLINIVPGNVSKLAGADIVIGVDMRGIRHIFSPWQITLKKIYNRVLSILFPNYIRTFVQKITEVWDSEYDVDKEQKKNSSNILSVLGKSMDIAILAQENDADGHSYCDYLIINEQEQSNFFNRVYTNFTNFSFTKHYYELGRQEAWKHLPNLWQLIADYDNLTREKEQALGQIFKQNQTQ